MATAFRLYSELDTFYGQSGQLLPGGSLKFYTAGTTTPKDVFGEEALTTNNGSTIALDSSGRPAKDIWGSGSYFVELFDADAVKQGEVDDLHIPGGDAQTVPVPSSGEFLTGDGTNFATAEIREVPDPTGHTGKQLGTDGAAVFWEDKPDITVPDPEIVVSASARTVQVGTSTEPAKFWIASGNDTAPATSQLTSTKALTFDPGFDALWNVIITPNTSGVTSNSPPAIPSWSVTGYTPGSASTGVTVTFYAPPVQTISSEDTIVSSIPFSWVAIGTRTISP